jgi:riboflavin synthase
MFTGIVECLGKILAIEQEEGNIHFSIQSPISSELKIDQSVSHNGVCLTVVKIEGDIHVVTAIQETLNKTDLAFWKVGDALNLERCLKVDARFDGHIVQGHVDCIAKCIQKVQQNGSWVFRFEYQNPGITVEKGSVTVSGISLTVVDSADQKFSVAIIPYTYEHTIMQYIQEGSTVNIEFDVVGKYIQKLMQKQSVH